MRRIVLSLVAVGLALVFAARVSSQANPWWDPRNPYGQSYGITIGSLRPASPADGLIMVVSNPPAAPGLQIYNGTTGAWGNIGAGGAGGTAGSLVMWDPAGTDLMDATAGTPFNFPMRDATGTNLGDSIMSDIGGVVLMTNALGSTTFPDYGVAVAPFVSVGGVIPNNPNCVWADTNEIWFEGFTANAFENIITTVDVLQQQRLTIPDIGEAAGNFVVSLLDNGAGDVGDSGAIWFAGNTIWFEGATADGNENRIITGDAGAGGAVYYLPAAPSDTYAFLVSYMEGNTPQAANSIWANTGEIVMEGTGANDFEIRIMADIVGVDSIIEFASPVAGASSNLMRILTDLTTVPMDNNDTVVGLDIAITNGNHGGANNVLDGIAIESIVQDAQATETGIKINTGWDIGILLPNGAIASSFPSIGFVSDPDTGFLWSGGANSFYAMSGGAIDMTFGARPAAGASGSWNSMPGSPLLAMNGSDTVNALLIDVTNVDHTGASNYLNMLRIGAPSLEDAEAVEIGIFIENGMDAHFVLDSMTAAPAENPPAGAVAFILDDNVDYSGGGGNDCCLIARTSGGATVVIATIVLNAACP